MTIYMNTSTTAMHVMDYLKETPVTVVTNNLRMSEQEMHLLDHYPVRGRDSFS